MLRFVMLCYDDMIRYNTIQYYRVQYNAIFSFLEMPQYFDTVLDTISTRAFRDRSLPWRHNEPDGVSNHQHHDCLLNRSFRRTSKKTSKLRVTGLCAGNSPETGEFPAQMASNVENVSIWWRHNVFIWYDTKEIEISNLPVYSGSDC